MQTNTRLLPMTLVLSALLCAVNSAGAEPREIPQTRYTCHVVTADGLDGIAFIQANSERQALASVVGARAYIASSSFDTSARAVECVVRGEGRLRSDAARQLLTSLVM